MPVPTLVPGADGLLRSLIADYHLMRGEALFARGNKDGALQEFRQAVAAHPDSKESINNIASTAAERRFLKEAERWYREAAALSPTYATPRRNLAKILDTPARREEAIAAYRDLLRATPDDAAAKARLEALLAGGIAPRESPFDQRIEGLLAAIRQDPQSPALYNNLGNVYAEQKNGKEALRAYEKAIEIDPRYALAYKNLAILYREVLHDPVSAERYLEKYRSFSDSKVEPR